MTAALHRLVKRLMGATLALCLGLSLILTSFVDTAKASSSAVLTGKYVEDTISVANQLKDTIAIAEGSEGLEAAEGEAVKIITDYISIYRGRSQVNGLDSFTTMQTALNSLAGHYKNYQNRPLPEKLKERLNKELSKAESNALREQ